MSNATERVGRYQLLEPIGIGPCGSVSRAKVFGVAGFERQFAVKRFHPELTSSPSTAQALSAAARGYGSLEHPRIARMSEFGVAQGTTFTAVEYVAGLDALRLIAEAKLAGAALAAGGALALVSQAARAIGYAHGRGLTHLGLSPTNVIVTSDGDVKITDFGILSSSLPQRPIDSSRLAHRIQYLAPEQIANEATSAATDVFALGVLAYELVTGQRTFRGDTPAQIAQAVMAGPPAEPPLPRPIVRVLQRCLARSPYERFPDARALADALDAALRVAPVPGTRKDIGAQVTQTLERIAALHEGELSGMLALDVGTGSRPTPGATAPVAARGGTFGIGEPATLETHVPDPGPLVEPSTTLQDLPKPFLTSPGLAPPPIPVPQGVASSPALAPAPSPALAPTAAGIGTSTLLGVRPVSGPPPTPVGKLTLAKGPGRTTSTPVPAIPRVMTPPPARLEPPPPRAASDDSSREIVIDPSLSGARGRSDTDFPLDQRTHEMAPLLVEQLKAETKVTVASRPLTEGSDPPALSDDESWPPRGGEAARAPSHLDAETQLELVTNLPNDPRAASADGASLPPSPSSMQTPLPTLPGVLPPTRSGNLPIPGGPTSGAIAIPSHVSERTINTAGVPLAPPARSRLGWTLAGALGIAALGVVGWFAYGALAGDGDRAGSGAVASPTARDAGAPIA
nr:protein kinase [Myxococcota bacterium]